MSKFKAGQSGNPNGRPKGALNKTTLATQALLDEEAEALTRKAVELAKTGNPMALRLCLERVLPPRKDRPINFTMPKVEGAHDLPKVLGAILEAVAKGEITPGEGQTLTTMMEAYRKGLETADFDARLTILEKRMFHGQS
jgi:Family of unknown function (DUF5681)